MRPQCKASMKKKSSGIFTCVSVRLSVFASALRSDPTTYWLPSNAFSSSSSCIGWNAVRMRFGFRYGCKKISTQMKKKKTKLKLTFINRHELDWDLAFIWKNKTIRKNAVGILILKASPQKQNDVYNNFSGNHRMKIDWWPIANC